MLGDYDLIFPPRDNDKYTKKNNAGTVSLQLVNLT